MEKVKVDKEVIRSLFERINQHEEVWGFQGDFFESKEEILKSVRDNNDEKESQWLMDENNETRNTEEDSISDDSEKIIIFFSAQTKKPEEVNLEKDLYLLGPIMKSALVIRGVEREQDQIEGLNDVTINALMICEINQEELDILRKTISLKDEMIGIDCLKAKIEIKKKICI